jgi:hypothetical protein
MKNDKMALKFLFPSSEKRAVIARSVPRRLLTFASIKRGETMAAWDDLILSRASSRMPLPARN